MNCPSCNGEISATHKSCPSCGGPAIIAGILSSTLQGIQFYLSFGFILFLVRVLFKNTWVAIAALAALLTAHTGNRLIVAYHLDINRGVPSYRDFCLFSLWPAGLCGRVFVYRCPGSVPDHNAVIGLVFGDRAHGTGPAARLRALCFPQVPRRPAALRPRLAGRLAGQ